MLISQVASPVTSKREAVANSCKLAKELLWTSEVTSETIPTREQVSCTDTAKTDHCLALILNLVKTKRTAPEETRVNQPQHFN
jgi:hypothetical protein